MTLIKSISGFRGTIGGLAGDALTPVDIVSLTAGYGAWLKDQNPKAKVVIGRDGRLTGPLVQTFVMNTLMMMGIDVIDAGLSTTPTIEMGVKLENADGGIVITASHNPMNWNALKLLNKQGEFLDADAGKAVLEYADYVADIQFSPIDEMGIYKRADDLLHRHIDLILKLPYVDVNLIRDSEIQVVVDPVNSSGSIAVKALLDQLHVQYKIINGEISGHFNHNPEPLAQNLTDLSEAVVLSRADMGIAVDPDVDRLAFVCEDGEMFGEENTLVSVSDFLLAHKKGDVVSNLSSTRGLSDIAAKHGHNHHASAVGEAHVVQKMKEVSAVIGGEGNGGVILPDLHYGRDALAGIALFLTHYAQLGKPMSEIKENLPTYFMSKQKATLNEEINPDRVLSEIKAEYGDHPGLSTIDGVKIDFEEAWVHMRKSNTEPIIRIYSEARSPEKAEELTQNFKEKLTANTES